MAIFQVEGPDGVYEVEAETIEQAAAAFDTKQPAEPPQQAPQPETTQTGAALLNAADAVTMGAFPRMIGAVGGGLEYLKGGEFSEGYNKHFQGSREFLDKSREEHPGTALASALAGGLTTLPFAPAFRAGQAATGLGQAAKNAWAAGKTGGAYGGIYGAMQSDDLTDLPQAVNSAAKGAAFGGALGSGVGVVGAGLKGVKDVGMARFRRPEQYGSRKMAQMLSEAGETPQSVNGAVQSGPQEMRVMDVLGVPGRRAAETVVTKGGKGGKLVEDFLLDRQATQPNRVAGEVQSLLGNAASFDAAKKAIKKTAKARAKPLYDAAYDTPIDYSGAGRKLEELTPRLPGSAIRKANELMKIDGVQSKQIMADIAENGGVTFKRMPDMRQWHYIKQGVDDLITEGKGTFGGMDKKSAKLSGLNSEINRVLKEVSPDYKAANRVWSDSIKLDNAMKAGMDWRKGRAAPIIDDFGKMTPEEQEMFRLGLSTEIVEGFSKRNDGADIINSIWNSRHRDVLQKVFGSQDDFAKFTKMINQEKDMHLTKATATGGSQTARRMGDQGEGAAEIAFDAAVDLGTGRSPVGIVSQLMKQGRKSGITKRQAEALAELLMSNGIDDNTLNWISRLERGNAAPSKMAGALARGLAPQVFGRPNGQ